MRYLTTRGRAPAATLRTALFDGLAPDGGLYVPETIAPWPRADLDALAGQPLPDIAARVLAPFAGTEVDAGRLREIAADALNFPIPLVEVEAGVFALELFHGPTLAFKDVGARVMARLMASLHDGGAPLTVLAATSGDTGSAVAHAFHGVPHTRVVVLYPEGRVSPTQEAQLTMFNAVDTNVRAFAVAGSFDDCQRLTKEAFADRELRASVRLTSANSINIGRLLPQMVYYFQAVALLARTRGGRVRDAARLRVTTPSGNFGNLTAGLMAKRLGLPIDGFVAATNVNDVVPAYLLTGRFEPRASIRTIANAMDVGNPSNFERMLWLYGDAVDRMRLDITGRRYTDREVRETIRRVHADRGYVLDPHSAIGYLGATGEAGGPDRALGPAIFLATAHPAKFGEVVEPVIGRKVEMPERLATALATPRRILTLEASLRALKEVVSSR